MTTAVSTQRRDRLRQLYRGTIVAPLLDDVFAELDDLAVQVAALRDAHLTGGGEHGRQDHDH